MGYITINSRFKPYSYDELVKPLLYYKEAYDKIEKDYSDLAAQAEAFKDIASQEENPEAYKLYKGYSDRLDKAMEDFSKGMNAATRKDLMKLKRDYSSTIGTISRAYQQASEENKRRSDMLAKNPNIKMKNKSVKVDEYLGGKTPANDYIDTSELLKRASLDFSNIAKTMVSDPKFKATANKYLYNVDITEGISPENLQKLMAKEELKGTAAEKLYKEVYDRYNNIDIEGYSPEDQEAIINTIKSAAYTGLSTTKNQFVSSGLSESQSNALNWARFKQNKDQFEANMRAKGLKPNGMYDPNNPIWKIKEESENNDDKDDKIGNIDRVVEIDVNNKKPSYYTFENNPADDSYDTVEYDNLTEEEKSLLGISGVKSPENFAYRKYKGNWFTGPRVVAIPLKFLTDQSNGENPEKEAKKKAIKEAAEKLKKSGGYTAP